MTEYGLIGFPLEHSASASYFNDKFHRLGIKAHYRLFPLPNISEFPSFLASHPFLCGLNVTSPHKIAVIDYLDELDPLAHDVGAVNTIRIERSTSSYSLKGYNTDVVGFRQSLVPHLKRFGHGAALILGNGGASKAVRKALDQLQIEHLTLSRHCSTENIGLLPYQDFDWERLQDFSIVINATPLGMPPHEDECPRIDYSRLSDRHLCYDLIYNPPKTLFLQRAESQGAMYVNGREMLEAQAEAAYHIWSR
ncbi:hypothetical protein HQ45_08595 [Porphyromonas crevioricanis]|uniref:Shikimate dehydrogenase substrate binding N-terminal domain-containing protein n=1 Tax=Porphyromonas crevioricanis TaxID=393921 RepID=A0AB34PGY1_9PORP|nr:shikimate dehydrogenase [Porphyromonas crevioricanis]KGN88746.1 hypothetical protein HQ45_08595 [Porphyromonas crevioricanis]KGN93884.1 hypothetical protein HQ38_07670 [Porphyromonas crevioricanis]